MYSFQPDFRLQNVLDYLDIPLKQTSNITALPERIIYRIYAIYSMILLKLARSRKFKLGKGKKISEEP